MKFAASAPGAAAAGKEKERDQSTRFPGALLIPSTMQLPILTGVSAPTAAVGDGFGSICGPLIA